MNKTEINLRLAAIDLLFSMSAKRKNLIKQQRALLKAITESQQQERLQMTQPMNQGTL
jgi:hypothetical protein